MDAADRLFALLLVPTDIPIMTTRATSSAANRAERFVSRVGDDDDDASFCVTSERGSSSVTWPSVSISIELRSSAASEGEALMIDVGGWIRFWCDCSGRIDCVVLTSRADWVGIDVL